MDQTEQLMYDFYMQKLYVLFQNVLTWLHIDKQMSGLR
jgi:hypothetical protein